MRIKDIFLGILACGAFVFASCSDDDFTESQSALNVVSAESSFAAAGGEKYINVAGPIVSAYSKHSWLTVSLTGSTITMNASVNGDSQSRNTIVVMKASETDSIVVNVSQLGARYEFTAPERLCVLSHGVSEVKLPILHTIPANPVPSASWIKVRETEDYLIFTFDAAQPGETRTAYVDIDAKIQRDRIEIVQYDIRGSFTLAGKTLRGADIALNGKLKAGENGSKLVFAPADYEGVEVPVEFVADKNALRFYGGQYCGTNAGYYIYTVLADTKSNKVSYDSSYFMDGLLSSTSAENSCTIEDAGSWEGRVINMFRLGKSTTENAANVRATLVDIVDPKLYSTVSAAKPIETVK